MNVRNTCNPPPPPHTHSFPLEGKQQACAAQCIPQLVRLLSDRDSDVRAQAAGALMRWARHFREQGSMNVCMYICLGFGINISSLLPSHPVTALPAQCGGDHRG